MAMGGLNCLDLLHTQVSNYLVQVYKIFSKKLALFTNIGVNWVVEIFESW